MKGLLKRFLAVSISAFIGGCAFLLCSTVILAEEAPTDTPSAPEVAEITAAAPVASSELLSLNFEDTDIRDVIKVVSEISGINMIVNPEIKATVTVSLKEVTWRQALEVILMTYNFTYKESEDGRLIRIMTLDQMKMEEEKIPLQTKIIPLNFAKAEELKPSLEKMKSSRGSIEINTRTNSLIVTDLPDDIKKIEGVIVQLDTRTPQVMIEALMADVKVTNDESMGIDWTVKDYDTTTVDDSNPNVGQGISESIFKQGLQLAGAASGTIAFGKALFPNSDYSLGAIIEVWKEDKRVDILANPRVLTLDNLQATIELVEQIPYTYTSTDASGSSEGTTSTQFKDAGIKLYVTPHITTKDNWISMNVRVEQSFRSGYTPGNEPIIDSRKAETNLMVRNGETIVIGGLRKKEETTTIDKIPFLGDIPYLGNLFRRTTVAKANVDLLIFITPTIILEPTLTPKERVRLDFSRQDSEVSAFSPSGQTGTAEKPGVVPLAPAPAIPEDVFSLRPPSKEAK